jgi:nitrite reductase/ring-hydroxylating ferredoxin subunit
MAGLDTYPYYFGLATAIVLGYFLSSLRIERLVIAAIIVLQERVGGKSSKKQTTEDGHTIASAKKTFLTPSILSGWTEENLFELERRAIFSKACNSIAQASKLLTGSNQTWLFVTHASRFQKPGDYRTYELAGFAFIIILGKDKQLRTFHNVCRHRAYAVTKKECGSSTVLGCRYHGWSYDTKGNLIKAPEFDNVPGFNKGKNGLWEIKTEVREGMVFINFDARPDIEDSSLERSDTMLPRRWGTAKMTYVADFRFEMPANWKFLGMYLFWASRCALTGQVFSTPAKIQRRSRGCSGFCFLVSNDARRV